MTPSIARYAFLAASIDGGAVDGGDDRRLEGEQAADDVVAARLRDRPGVILVACVAVGHRLDVAARAEGAPGARQHDDVHGGITVHIVEDALELIEHRRVRRVQPLGAVEGDGEDALVAELDLEELVARVVHVRSPRLPGAQSTRTNFWTARDPRSMPR